MNKPLILVVEDDRAIRNLITTTLEMQGYQYHTAGTGGASILEAVSHKPDIIILDLGLPDMDGVEIIKKIRSWSNVPIIVVSARSEDREVYKRQSISCTLFCFSRSASTSAAGAFFKKPSFCSFA